MLITINTKGKWDSDLFDEDGALLAKATDVPTKKELERTLIEVSRFLCQEIENIEND